jgi:hypothetical protein
MSDPIEIALKAFGISFGIMAGVIWPICIAMITYERLRK